jgi:hypothetical protein
LHAALPRIAGSRFRAIIAPTRDRPYPLDHRRVTVAEEHTLIAFAAERLTTGMGLCHDLAVERPARSWPEQVLPYGHAAAMLVTPTGWTLTETTRAVRLRLR